MDCAVKLNFLEITVALCNLKGFGVGLLLEIN